MVLDEMIGMILMIVKPLTDEMTQDNCENPKVKTPRCTALSDTRQLLIISWASYGYGLSAMGFYLVERLHKPFDNSSLAISSRLLFVLRTLIAVFVIYTTLAAFLWAQTAQVVSQGDLSHIVLICTRDLTTLSFYMRCHFLSINLCFNGH